MKNVGRKSLYEIKLLLERIGLSLGMEWEEAETGPVIITGPVFDEVEGYSDDD
jgi:DNA-directed RNA polymerase alpha subunit